MLPIFCGVETVIAKSLASIHKNLINYGIVQRIFKNKDDCEKIDVDNVLVQADKGGITIRIVNNKDSQLSQDIKGRCHTLPEEKRPENEEAGN